jgi:hypothetical protein
MRGGRNVAASNRSDDTSVGAARTIAYATGDDVASNWNIGRIRLKNNCPFIP